MKREIKFKKVSDWQKENVLKGFEIKQESNKYEKVTSQVNEDETIVLIRIAESNLKFVNDAFGYVVSDDVFDENGEHKIFGQKWFKKFNVLDNVWFGEEYLVAFNKDYFRGDFNELIELAREQENCEIETKEEEIE